MVSHAGLSEDSDSAGEDQPRPNQLRRGRSHGLRHAERAVTWTDAQLATLQVSLPLLVVHHVSGNICGWSCQVSREEQKGAGGEGELSTLGQVLSIFVVRAVTKFAQTDSSLKLHTPQHVQNDLKSANLVRFCLLLSQHKFIAANSPIFNKHQALILGARGCPV